MQYQCNEKLKSLWIKFKNFCFHKRSYAPTIFTAILLFFLIYVTGKIIFCGFLNVYLFGNDLPLSISEKLNAYLLALTGIFIFIYTLDTHRMVGVAKKQRSDDIRKKVYEQLAEIYSDIRNTGNALLLSLRNYKQDLTLNKLTSDTQIASLEVYLASEEIADRQDVFKDKILKNQKELIKNFENLLFQFFNQIDIWEVLLYKVNDLSDETRNDCNVLLTNLYKYNNSLSIPSAEYNETDNMKEVMELLGILNKCSNLFCKCHNIIFAGTELSHFKNSHDQIWKDFLNPQIKA
ncbi:hypothetical protein COT94_01935 [Candidatus Falkowbacteria bacterium CG10_big_fil_rev_8_21_14_0_10_37_14]|uniref:Uncharacterized protein n=1 Tax=Candidatus Falkowbacteria bacterium CG10_big_fil_rev_8_21_14_0_10_37_14 TaxID=1974561 RepID=A0A2M6WT86_9BACT|nr:MAG: hypothetical protein COT94_01935 [Candidatus Falkowbacteria bacterium CG10_big_fil_rev_8_21_14_0_10_37_14]